jgi:hypothetical protein
MDRAIVRQATLKSNVVTVPIPNSILQYPLTIKAHIGVYEGDEFKVIETISIPVIPKVKPSDYRLENSDEEVYSFNALENLIVNTSDLVLTELQRVSDELDNAIVESGTIGIWKYIKWSNGDLDCIGVYEDTLSKTLDFAGLAAYTVEIPLPTDLFIEEPRFVNHTVQIGTALTIPGMAEPWPEMVKLWALSVDGTHDTMWRVFVSGKWK